MPPVIAPDFSEFLEQLPEGEYKARIQDVEAKTSAKGTHYLRWQLTVFGAADPRVNGKPISMTTPTAGAGLFRLTSLYKAVTGKQLAQGESFDTDELMGKELGILVVAGKNPDGTLSGYPEVKSVRAI